MGPVYYAIDPLPEPETEQSSQQVLQAPPPSSTIEQPTSIQDLELNIAIQEAVGPYDSNPINTEPPLSINEVLSGKDWM